ncbi:MAG: methylcobamide--CoM methyltransferase [Clostridia bacterium]|nr:methylcobamide--CoM methyltransferase [Clostridia bacterium]
MRDFPCTYLQAGTEEYLGNTTLPVPEVHLDAEYMAALAIEYKNISGSEICMLPFCHTVEAEALGAMINYGDRKTGPRVKDYAFSSVEDIMDLPDMVFSEGRIAQVLRACRSLADNSETVVLEITGPFTMLGSLIDPTRLFRFMRKEPEKTDKLFKKLADNILAYMKEAEKNGVTIISYADPVGGVSIVGPKIAETMAKEFTLPLLRRADGMLDKNVLIHLCPKTAFVLQDTGCVSVETMDIEENIFYLGGLSAARGKVRFIGMTCLKNNKLKLNGKLQYMTLK